MLYGDVFKALNEAKVKYVVAGGAAVILYGYPRLTQDLDLIVFLEEKNLEKLFVALHNIGYLPKVPVTKDQFKDPRQRIKWKKEKGMIVFSFVHRNPPFNIIDIFVDEPIKFDSVYKKRKNVKVEGIAIPLIGIDHLIRLKKAAQRPKDLDDIVQLRDIKRVMDI